MLNTLQHWVGGGLKVDRESEEESPEEAVSFPGGLTDSHHPLAVHLDSDLSQAGVSLTNTHIHHIQYMYRIWRVTVCQIEGIERIHDG